MPDETLWFKELRAIVEELGFVDSRTFDADVLEVIKALLRGDATIPSFVPNQYSLTRLEAEHLENASKVESGKKLAATYRRLRIPVSITVNKHIVMNVDSESVHLTIKG